MAYLLKDTKQKAGSLLKATFERDPQKAEQQVSELADELLNPEKLKKDDPRSDDTIGWLKQFIAGDVSFDDFCQIIRNYDDSALCGCVWTAHFVAYRCKTCATSPCMSICAGCFERGNHEGHDYNIFRSEAGGACDCGDASVMDKAGFCKRHGPNRIIPQPISQTIIGIGKLFIRRMVLALIHSLRLKSKDTYLETSAPLPLQGILEELLELLIDLLKLGSPIRSFVSQFLRDEKIFQDLNQGFPSIITVSPPVEEFHKESFSWFTQAVAALRTPKVSDAFKQTLNSSISKRYSCYLYEMMFWTVRYEFHEKLILFLLNLLSDSDCKEEFARSFVRHYTRIAPSLITSMNIEPLSNRVVHISVQLFSNEELAYKLCREENLLEILLTSLYFVVSQNLEESQTSSNDYHQCVAASSRGLRANSYWPIVSDLVNVLGHHKVALMFLGNDDILNIWMQLLTYFSGMDLTVRELNEHVLYEPQYMLLAFYSEREACATPLWCLLDSLQHPGTKSLSVKFINFCLEAVVELLDALENPSDDWLPFNQISYHYPLHRYLALFIGNAINKQGLKFEELDISEEVARRIMAHPLQVLATTAEVQASMWVRNGVNISTQSLAYRQSFFCTFFVDADVFMLQLCSRFVSPGHFVSAIFDRCRTEHCMSVLPTDARYMPFTRGGGDPDSSQLISMVEATFNILITILTNATHLGLSEAEIIEKELMALLVQQTWTHSSLSEHIPQCHDLHAGDKSKRYMKPLNNAIEHLAEPVAGDPMAQTKFTLREESWKHFDPIFSSHRALYKKYTHQAHTRYFEHLQQIKKVASSTAPGEIWKPYKEIRIPSGTYSYMNDLLNCTTLHSVLFMVVYKYLKEHTAISEQTLSLALVLLEACVHASTKEEDEGEESQSVEKTVLETSEFLREEAQAWFESNMMSYNIRQEIDTVTVLKMRPRDDKDDVETLPAGSSSEESMHTCGEETPPKQDEEEEMMDTEQSNSETQESGSAVDPPKPASYVCAPEYVEVKESLLSLLLKLHAKVSGSKSSFLLPSPLPSHVEQPVPVVCRSMVEKILIMAAMKSKKNEDELREYCLLNQSSVIAMDVSGNFIEAERALKKEKAKKMQEKMQLIMKMRAQKFLEKMEAEINEATDLDESIDFVDGKTEEEYSCIICRVSESSQRNPATEGARLMGETSTINQTASSSVQQVMCEIVLAQSSNVLGNRLPNDQLKYPIKPESNVPELETCRKTLREKKQSAEKCFPTLYDTKFFENDFDWDRSPHVSTCGHNVHLTCIKNYLKWLEREEMGYRHFEAAFGFPCPLCRQTSSHYIPCNIKSLPRNYTIRNVDFSNLNGEEKQTKLKRFCAEIYERIEDSPQMSEINEPQTLIINDITQQIAQHWQEAAIAMSTESDSSKSSILRGNLEYDLLQRGASLLPTQKHQLGKPPRKIPIASIFHLLCKDVNISIDVSEVASLIWSKLYNPAFSTWQDKYPILCKDAVELLLKLCCVMYPVSHAEFKVIVRIMYILSVVQALVQMSCKFSATERRAWKSNVSVALGGVPFDPRQLQSLLGYVIYCLPTSLFNNDSSSAECLTSTVYSPQSVHSLIKDNLLHFLQISSLLQHHIFEIKLPSLQNQEDEFAMLSQYLDLTQNDGESGSVVSSIIWPTSPQVIIKAWCDELISMFKANAVMQRSIVSLLIAEVKWSLPSLIQLPTSYNAIFQQYRQVHCEFCGKVARESALCLVCGRFVCYKGDCSKLTQTPSLNSYATHLRNCGNGTAIFLVVNSSIVKIIRGKRICDWGTLYLDLHGEEDRDWKRGRPLFLKQERYALLETQWRDHMFDNSCSQWSHLRGILRD